MTHKTIASRIPEKYIVVKGEGQSDFGPGNDPWETTAYDLALLQGGIENCNVVKYTSVIPPEAFEIDIDTAKKEGLFHHGMVLECIMAQVNGNKNDAICAGVGMFNVFKPGAKEGEDELVGGFAVEYEGGGSPDHAQEMLDQSMGGLFDRRYHDLPGYYMADKQFHIQDMIVDDDFGTVLVAIGFLSFIVPVLE